MNGSKRGAMGGWIAGRLVLRDPAGVDADQVQLAQIAPFRDVVDGAVAEKDPDRLVGLGHVNELVDRVFLPGAIDLDGDRAAPSRRSYVGVVRKIVSEVSGFAAAISLARASDLIATVPERHTRALRRGMASFPIPVQLPQFTVSLLWHPRVDGDPAHRWLRGCVREICVVR